MATSAESFRTSHRTPSTAWAVPWSTPANCCAIRVYTRFLHWMVGIFFFLALLSGFGIYLPWIFRFFTPLFGGGAMTRLLHPWFGLGFVFFFSLQAINWLAGDALEARRFPLDEAHQDYITAASTTWNLPEVGFFNAGQKLHVLGDRRAAASLTSLPA